MTNYFFDVLPTELQQLIYHKNLLNSIESKDLQLYDNIWVLYPKNWIWHKLNFSNKSYALTRLNASVPFMSTITQTLRYTLWYTPLNVIAAHIPDLHQVLVVDDIPNFSYEPYPPEFEDYYFSNSD